MITYEQWETERVVGRIWYCGDVECDCRQPVVERITPNRKAGYPWINRERLWEGTYLSRDTEEPDGPHDSDLMQELRVACTVLRIDPPE